MVKKFFIKKIFVFFILVLFLSSSIALSDPIDNVKVTTNNENILNTQTNNSAIIICGGKDDFSQSTFEKTANIAYQTFRKLGYSDDDIYYLSRNTSFQGIDKKDTVDNIRYAITTWLKNRSTNDSKYFIFLADHGNSTKGQVTVNDGFVYPKDLADWLDNVTCYSTGTILVEACYQ